MTAVEYLSQAYRLDIRIRDLDLLSIGMVNDMYAENSNDEVKYAKVASQEDFDVF